MEKQTELVTPGWDDLVHIFYDDPAHELSRRHELESMLESILSQQDLGMCDGGGTGLGESEIYIYGSDGNKMWDAIELTVRSFLKGTNIYVIVRQGHLEKVIEIPR